MDPKIRCIPRSIIGFGLRLASYRCVLLGKCGEGIKATRIAFEYTPRRRLGLRAFCGNVDRSLASLLQGVFIDGLPFGGGFGAFAFNKAFDYSLMSAIWAAIAARSASALSALALSFAASSSARLRSAASASACSSR